MKKNSFHEEIASKLKKNTYLAKLYRTWDKGAIKKQRQTTRQNIPKGTDFTGITDEQVMRVQDIFNLETE